MVDVRQSKVWAEYLKSLGWKVIEIRNSKFEIRIYVKSVPLFGSIIKIPRIAPPIPFKEVDRVAKENRALFVKLEPNVEVSDQKTKKGLESCGFKEETWSLQPTKTIVIDLTPSEEELLAKMEKDTRYSIRKSEREGVVVEKSTDIDEFLSLHKETSKRQGFWTSEKDSRTLWETLPEGNKTLLFAKKDGKILAGAFLSFYGDIAYYYEAASSDHRRDLLAPYLVVWESMRLAKEKGCKKFDFEGIFDPRISATKGWKGFTHFKKGFGGQEVTYLGSFIKFYNPIIKFIFLLNRFF